MLKINLKIKLINKSLLLIIEINTMTTLTDEQRNNNDNYLTIMNDFLTELSNIVLS